MDPIQNFNPNFVYPRLELCTASEFSFRVVEIHPRHNIFDDGVVCTLRPLTLPVTSSGAKLGDNNPSLIQADEYEAISYTWGNSPASRIITLDNQPFKVRPNLEDALESLRLQDRKRLIWVDAICIDQGNLLERQNQVAIMRDIYANASAVTIWLGRGDNDIKECFRGIDDWHSGGDLPNSRLYDTNVYREKYRFQLIMAVIYTHVLPNSWWSRVWIIQEVAVARRTTLRCGQVSLPWTSFLDFLSLFRDPEMHRRGRVGSPPYRIEHIKHVLDAATSLTLYEVLAHFRGFEATDPHDKVYAVLGLASRQDKNLTRDMIPALYNQPLQETCCATVKYSLWVEKNTNILTAAGLSPDESGWPSWVPNWGHTSAPTAYAVSSYRWSLASTQFSLNHEAASRHDQSRDRPVQARSGFRASNHTLPKAQIVTSCANLSTLKIRGVIFDVVNCTSHQGPTTGTDLLSSIALIQRSFESPTLLRRLAHHLVLASDMVPSEDLGKMTGDFLLHLPVLPRVENSSVASRIPPNLTLKDRASLEESLSLNTATTMPANTVLRYCNGEPLEVACWRSLTTDRTLDGLRTSIAHDSCVKTWLEAAAEDDATAGAVDRIPRCIDEDVDAMRLASIHRKFGISADGLLCLLPDLAQRGDVITVVFGCDIPLLLRPCDEGTHRLVGECYVHGIMDGEIMEIYRREDDVDFILV